MIGDDKEAANCRASLDKLDIFEPGKPVGLRKEYDRIKDMRPLELGPYMKNIYTSTQDLHLTEHARQAKKYMLDKVFAPLAVRSASELERAMIFKLQDLVGVGGLDRHSVLLATSVAAGKVSEDKVAMGLLEGAMMKLATTDGSANFRGRLSRCTPLVKDRLQMCSSLCGFEAVQYKAERHPWCYEIPICFTRQKHANSVDLRSSGRQESDA